MALDGNVIIPSGGSGLGGREARQILRKNGEEPESVNNLAGNAANALAYIFDKPGKGTLAAPTRDSDLKNKKPNPSKKIPGPERTFQEEQIAPIPSNTKIVDTVK
jgi:hypothetical protein